MIDPATFNAIRRLVHQRSGIAVSRGKEAMVAKRVRKRMRALNIGDFRSYMDYLQHDRKGQEIEELLDVMTTNVTSFFRQPEQFEFVAQEIRHRIDARQRRFRFWSAACATGEEAYSLAITALDAVRGAWTDVKILATDLSNQALGHSRKGVFSSQAVAVLSDNQRERYFERHGGPDGFDEYAANGLLRGVLSFHRLNLSHIPYPMKGPFDAILCRNVMIYFDNELRRRLLAEMYRLLKPGGFLLTGHAESLTCMLSEFRVLHPSIYLKGPSA
jgi:chemotaxis protein methyltransferase CheR